MVEYRFAHTSTSSSTAQIVQMYRIYTLRDLNYVSLIFRTYVYVDTWYRVYKINGELGIAVNDMFNRLISLPRVLWMW